MAKRKRIKSGESISAKWLNKKQDVEPLHGHGSGNSDEVLWFKASEGFSEYEDVYRGYCKRYFRDPATMSYAVHGSNEWVYTFSSGVGEGDLVSAAWNSQSGRYEIIGSPPAGFIMFRPIDVCEGIGQTCDCVLATVITASCDSNVEPGDEVQVWDLNRGYLQLPPELLWIATGFAHYMKVHESSYDSGLPFEIGDCRWVVTGMGCVEDVE